MRAEAEEQRDPVRRVRAMADADAWLADRRSASPLPEFRKPLDSLRRVWNGFWDLQGDRQISIGMGGASVGSVPYLALSQWLRDSGFSPGTDGWLRAKDLLTRLDREYVVSVNRKLNDAGSKEEAGKGDAAMGE